MGVFLAVGTFWLFGFRWCVSFLLVFGVCGFWFVLVVDFGLRLLWGWVLVARVVAGFRVEFGFLLLLGVGVSRFLEFVIGV